MELAVTGGKASHMVTGLRATYFRAAPKTDVKHVSAQRNLFSIFGLTKLSTHYDALFLFCGSKSASRSFC